MIFNIVPNECKVPPGTIIGYNYIEMIDYFDDDESFVPKGDEITLNTDIMKYKFLERIVCPDLVHGTNRIMFIEKHCLKFNNEYFQYMVRLIYPQGNVRQFIFPVIVESIKAKLLNKAYSHQTPTSVYIEKLTNNTDIDTELLNIIQDTYLQNRGMIDCICVDSDKKDTFMGIYRNDILEYSDNMFTWNRAEDIASTIIRKLSLNITSGYSTVDESLLKYGSSPFLFKEIGHQVDRTSLIDAFSKYDLPKDMDWNYDSRICDYYSSVYRILTSTAITDLNIRYILSNRQCSDVKYYSRYPLINIKDIVKNVIRNINRSLNNSTNSMFSYATHIDLFKNFDDEIGIVVYKNKDILGSYYWDSSIMTLVSPNMVIWPE